MKTVFALELKNLFSAYANRMADYTVQYLCDNCSQKFSALWNLRVNIYNPWASRGNFAICPFCGHTHSKYIGYVAAGTEIPYTMTIKLIRYKKSLSLRIKYEAITFDEKMFSTVWTSGKETYHFDIEGRKTVLTKEYSDQKGTTLKGTIPVNALTAHAILNNSILAHFKPNNAAFAKHRKQFVELLRLMREGITSINKTFGREQESLFTYCDLYKNGFLLLPIVNMAHKLEQKENVTLTRDTKFDKTVSQIYLFEEGGVVADLIYEKAQQGQDALTTLIQMGELPNSEGVRSILAKNYRQVTNLQKAFSILDNYDLALRLCSLLQISDVQAAFFKEILPIYGDKGVIQFAENEKSYNLRDCINLYRLLNEENRQAFFKAKVRLRDLHDWMVQIHRKQVHKNVSFSVPPHIVNRLSMQVDKLKFFLPKESIELVETGATLHNCVASYSNAMQDQNAWVVIVADDNGKYVACIELNGNRIRQAKIDRNKPVRRDNAANQAVLDWAKKAKLKIDTIDIAIEEQKQGTIKTA